MRTTTVDDPSAVHACAVPGSDEQLWEMTARFLGIGLAAGEQVVYLSDGTADAVLERLVDDRIPVDRPLADGQLTIVDPETTRASMRVPVRDAAGALEIGCRDQFFFAGPNPGSKWGPVIVPSTAMPMMP